jgi:hypothetical protein
MNFTKKKVIIIFLLTFLGIGFIGTSAIAEIAFTNQSATGFIAAKAPTDVNLNDGLLSEFWVNVTSYQNISEFGEGGYVKFANNDSHLYSLLVFPRDSGWVSVEFEPEPDECMTNLNDGWSFYTSESPDSVEAKDIKFVGVRMPDDDMQTDIKIEAIFESNMAYVELVRPFDTSDPDGFDIVYTNGSLNMMQFASQADHIGAHKDYFLLITDSMVGEEPQDPGVDIPTGANLGQIKFLLLGATPLGVFVFIIFHAFRRVFSSPIKHDFDRVVGNSHKAPTFMERFRATFLTKE